MSAVGIVVLAAGAQGRHRQHIYQHAMAVLHAISHALEDCECQVVAAAGTAVGCKRNSGEGNPGWSCLAILWFIADLPKHVDVLKHVLACNCHIQHSCRSVRCVDEWTCWSLQDHRMCGRLT